MSGDGPSPSASPKNKASRREGAPGRLSLGVEGSLGLRGNSLGCQPPILLGHNAQVVPARQQRHACSRRLRKPPEPPDPGVLADHHSLAQEIHERRAHLDGGINRIGTGERFEKWIRFPAVSARNGAACGPGVKSGCRVRCGHQSVPRLPLPRAFVRPSCRRSEEHTSELQSLTNLVCRLLLEKKKKKKNRHQQPTNSQVRTKTINKQKVNTDTERTK